MTESREDLTALQQVRTSSFIKEVKGLQNRLRVEKAAVRSQCDEEAEGSVVVVLVAELIQQNAWTGLEKTHYSASSRTGKRHTSFGPCNTEPLPCADPT